VEEYLKTYAFIPRFKPWAFRPDSVTNFYDDMFLVLWGKGLSTDFDKMKAYDSDNNLLVESSHPGEYIIFPIP